MTPLPDAAARLAAITTHDKTVVVTAGAGTGKTSLLVERIVELLFRTDTPLDITDIVALTFTNKAAGEMRQRLRDTLHAFLAFTSGHANPAEAGRMGEVYNNLLDRHPANASGGRCGQIARAALGALDRAHITTMHSFAGNLLRLYPTEAGVDPEFQEADGIA